MDNVARNLFLEAVRYHMMPDKQAQLHSHRSQPRKPILKVQVSLMMMFSQYCRLSTFSMWAYLSIKCAYKVAVFLKITIKNLTVQFSNLFHVFCHKRYTNADKVVPLITTVLLNYCGMNVQAEQ